MSSDAPTPTNTGDADGPDAAEKEKRPQAKAETRSGREDHATGGEEAQAKSAKKKKKHKEDTGERPEAPPELRDGAVQRLDLSGGEPAPAAASQDGDGDAAMAEAPAPADAATVATVALSEEVLRVAAKYGKVETDGIARRGWVKAISLEGEDASTMLLRVAAERKEKNSGGKNTPGEVLVLGPLMCELDRGNRPRNKKVPSLISAIKKVLKGASAAAFLAAAVPEADDDDVVPGNVDFWLIPPDGSEPKEIKRFDYATDAADHFGCHVTIAYDALGTGVAEKSPWYGKIAARKVDPKNDAILKDSRVVRGPHAEKSKGGGGMKGKGVERVTEHVRATAVDDAARRERYAEEAEREHREAGLWGDSLFGGGTGMWHPPPDRPDLPTEEVELRELLARAFPLPPCADFQLPTLSDSDDSDL